MKTKSMQCYKRMQVQKIGHNQDYGSGLKRFIFSRPGACCMHASEITVPCHTVVIVVQDVHM